MSAFTDYISVGTATAPSFYGLKNTINYGDGSSRDYYVGVFKANNTITPQAGLEFKDVTFLLAGGGGGGAGGYNTPGGAQAGSGGGGGGHLLVRAQALNSGTTFPIGQTLNVVVGSGGTGGAGSSSGSDGGSTRITPNSFVGAGDYPDVSGGSGGQNAVNGGGLGGYIRYNGSTSGFTVLNDNNGGNGGLGGTIFTGPEGFGYSGGQGFDASPTATGDYGNPANPADYYIAQGGGFNNISIGSGAGAAGGFYSSTQQDISGYGTRGSGGGKYASPPNDTFGYGGNYFIGTPTGTPWQGQDGTPGDAELALSQRVYAGAGGGGAGTPFSSVTTSATGGNGADGVMLIWFSIVVPAVLPGPYYTLRYSLSNVISVSNELVFGDGSRKTSYTALLSGGEGNSIEFDAAAVGLSAEILLIGGGGGGGGGMNQNFTHTGQGGGGAGHILGQSLIDAAGPLVPGTIYEITIGNGGPSGGGANPGENGSQTVFGTSQPTAFQVAVSGGGGGAAANFPGGFGAAGTITSTGFLSTSGANAQVVAGGAGGVGGSGGSGPSSGSAGTNSANGRDGYPGYYLFPGFGAVAASGAGGGGAGIKSFSSVKDISGQGGFAGLGYGGAGGTYPYYGSQYSGTQTSALVTTTSGRAGAGGGGGGVPYGHPTEQQSFGGGGANGLFLVNIEVDTPPPPPPSSGPNYINPYFAFDNSNDQLYVQEINGGVICQCGGTPGLGYIAITTGDNALRFFPTARDFSAEFILVGAGGQGGGGVNSTLQHAGQGGGGGGLAYGAATVGGEIAIDISYDIELGYNLGTGGYGHLPGSDGSGSRFGANIWSPFMEVSGGYGGGVLTAAGGGGGVVSYGPLVKTSGGSGGAGGLQAVGGEGIAGVNAVATPYGVNGKYVIPTYGTVITGGGGGGGAGISGEDISGSGGIGGRGSGGAGGSLYSLPFDGSNAELYALAGTSVGGGGGGGGGQPTQVESISTGGDGAGGLFVMILSQPSNCNPVDPICGCETYDYICGCGRVYSCPPPVLYTPLVTGGNDPQFNPAINYAMHVRASYGRPGYQRFTFGSKQLNAFGSYAGAPGGYRQPPKNRFN